MAEVMPRRYASDVASMDGSATATLWTVRPLAKARVVKILIYNADSADHIVTLGELDPTGPTFTQKLVAIPVSAGEMVKLTEDEIPRKEVVSTTSSIKAWAAALEGAVTANNVQVQIEVEEY